MEAYRPAKFNILPPIIKNLIIINVIFALLQFVLLSKFKINLQDILALHYWRSADFKIWQPFTYMFMHGSPVDMQATAMHLFSNMFGLWVFGGQLERMWGPKRFLTFYILCGIGAGLLFMGIQGVQYEPMLKSIAYFNAEPTLDHYEQVIKQLDIASTEPFNLLLRSWYEDPGNVSLPQHASRLFGEYAHLRIDMPMVGASGAVFGIIFAFGYLFPNTQLFIIPFPFPIKAKWVVAGYGLIELVAGIQNSPTDPVAHFAHLGGMVVAFFLLKFWLQRNRFRFY